MLKVKTRNTLLLFIRSARESYMKKILAFSRVWRYNTFCLGALAQLVARNVRNVEVRGSNPLCSTKAESDELLLLDHRVRSKGEDLRTQKFCNLRMGVAIIILGKG